jgi:hypothetical protein
MLLSNNLRGKIVMILPFFLLNMKKLPTYKPSYLEKHNLWDSQWLEKKYPERFKPQNNRKKTAKSG